jgi:hypothetical protein
VVVLLDVRCWLAVTVFRTLPLAVVLLVGACTTQGAIEQVQVTPGPDASTGVFRQSCGRNAERHLNADNAVISPGLPNGAHHTHEYVGNLSTDAFSTPESLAAAPSTCAEGDLSAYFWPVLRLTDAVGHDADEEGGGVHGNTGEVLPPDSVSITFTGNPASKVVPLPRFLRTITGNPSAATSGGLNANAKWGCTGFDERFTTTYPRCPAGSKVSRTFDFPGCWDGRNVDSASHRDHIVPAAANGVCPAATFPVPRLRLVVTYAVPSGRPFAVDSFPEERRDPITDHAMFVNVFPDALMAEVAACLNEGRACG